MGSVYEQNGSSASLGLNFQSSVVWVMIPGKTIRNIESLMFFSEVDNINSVGLQLLINKHSNLPQDFKSGKSLLEPKQND